MFWEGVLAGYGIAVPVGAIAVLIVDVGLRRGFGLAFMAGAGAATADLLYASLAMAAGEVLASALAPYSTGLRLASALALMALGVVGLWRAWSRQGRGAERSGDPAPAVRTNAHLRIYGQFLGLTILNPLTFTYFSALILGRRVGVALSVGGAVAFVAGAALSSLSWQTFLAGVGALANQRVSPRFQAATSVVGSLIVIGLGVRFLVGVWPDLFI